MIVTCPRCLTKFNLPDEKMVPEAKLQLHCSRCGWEFLFSPLPEDDELQVNSDPSLPPIEEELETIHDDMLDLVELERADESGPVEIPSSNVEGEVEESPESGKDDAVFELSDDFDEDQETEFDEELDFQSDELEPEVLENSEKEVVGQELEELALNLDDLNLDDIEFDNFGDEPLEGNAEASPEGRPTQIDDAGDLDDLLKLDDELPVKDVTSKVKEPVRKEPAPSQKVEKTPQTVNNKRNFILALSCFLVLSLALWAGYGLWQRFSVDMKKHLKLVEVENQRLRLPSGRIVIVLRGKVTNSSPKLVTDLKIKGILLDAKGQAVAEMVTSGGVSFSEEELDRLDGSKLAMLENSSVTLPANGGELPFMIAFYDYPEKACECYVELSSFKVKKGRWSK